MNKYRNIIYINVNQNKPTLFDRIREYSSIVGGSANLYRH